MAKSTKIIVALLPIKAHSERIKNKNFKLFGGKPLFMWCLETLLSIKEITKVVINTDARNILLKNGLIESSRVQIRDRKPAICGDFVSMNSIIADDISNIPADIYIMTHTTNPLLRSGSIRSALRKFIDAKDKGSHDSLFAVTRYQSRFYKKDGTAINHNPGVLIRTQDLEPVFEENSNLYIFTGGSFALTNSRIGLSSILFETPFLESFDIDDQEHWEVAESIIKTKLKLDD